jgi:hypothetical protein
MGWCAVGDSKPHSTLQDPREKIANFRKWNEGNVGDFWAREADFWEGLVEQLEAAQAENRMLRMWLCTDGARARGLAQSMTELPIAFSVEGVEENCQLIVELLNIEQRLGFPSASSPASRRDG